MTSPSLGVKRLTKTRIFGLLGQAPSASAAVSALRLGFEWVVSDGNELIPDTDCLVEFKLLHLNRTSYSVAPQTPGSFLEVRVCASCLSASVEERARAGKWGQATFPESRVDSNGLKLFFDRS